VGEGGVGCEEIVSKQVDGEGGAQFHSGVRVVEEGVLGLGSFVV